MCMENREADTIGSVLEKMPFSIEEIMIPWQKTITIERKPSKAEAGKKARKMKGKYIDLIVVVDENGLPLGTATIEALTEYDGKRPLQVIQVGEHKVKSSSTIPDVVKKMIDFRTNANELYFVTDNDGKCAGVFNYADFNKRICYFYAYGVLLMLEQLCRLALERLFDQNSDRRDKWLEKLSHKDQDEINGWSKKNKEPKLSCASLSQLLKALKNMRASDVVIGFVKHSTLSPYKVNNVRIRVAHPVKFLVKKSEILYSLECLQNLWGCREDVSRLLKDRKIGAPQQDCS